MNKELLDKSFKKAINGGGAGFLAMSFQVTSFMWLRTIVNHQYRNGLSFNNTFKLLYKEGGILRFYYGYPFALMLAPLVRFGDTAMNIGMMSILEESNLSIANKTFMGSCGAVIWRGLIMPIDTCKTSLQVNGNNGLKILSNKINNNGYRVLYNGVLASASSTLVGHFPWFFTYNYLNKNLPKKEHGIEKMVRSAIIGFSASSLSDISSNAFRIIKTNKQSNENNISYNKLIKNILEKDGIIGLITRGLKTKILTNGLQGMCFTIMFDYLYKN